MRRPSIAVESLEGRTLFSVPTPTNALDLTPVGTYVNGAAGASEIVAHDPATQRVFSVNAANGTVDVLDVSNPAAPALVKSISMAPFGAAANSVAIRNGVVAVAVEAAVKQDPGRVVFFDANGTFLNQVTVGALPDMVTFTPDGKRVLVANEGEPNSYGQANSVDPVGSVSVINLSNGVAAATVQTAGFTQFNGQEAALRAQGIRIFGPGASAAQDFEPEYVAVSPDSSTAYVTLQENNAIAIIDVATAAVTQLVPLGLKDFSKPIVEDLDTFNFANLPSIGTTVGGQNIDLGGFSGLQFEGRTNDGKLKFVTHTDRGPNGEPTGVNRPFLLPNFAPEVVRFELDPSTGAIAITQRIQLKRADGTTLLTGLPNTTITGGNGNTAYNDEVPVDLNGNVLPLDPLGGDFEGIAVAADGTFWLCDEYRPALYHFAADGVLIERVVPQGTVAAYNAGRSAGEQVPAGAFGTESLPAVLAQRRQNRGFEAIAIQDGKVYAFVQSPLRNPTSLSNGALNGMQNIRLVEFDPATQAAKQYLYVMDNPPAANANDTRADKIGDMTALGNGQFLTVERDDDSVNSGDVASDIQKKVYRFSVAGATELTPAVEAQVQAALGKTVDQATPAELLTNGLNVRPIGKTLHVDLNAAGYNGVEKVEGLTVVDADTIAVINDNDFTVAQITIDPATGTFTRNPGYTGEPVTLGLIKTRSTGLDASDRDGPSNTGRINIQNWPVFGAYMPDAIAAYAANGQTFLVTANEGDARDYTGFAEEIRVGASGYALDPVVFPNAAALKNNAALGRLTVTSQSGNLDADPEFERIVTLGGRSISIRDAAGNLVWDSGDALEQLTAAQVPSLFNSDGTAASFDTRSDNKGPEPEGVVVGQVGGRTYAFVGLERTNGIVVYDVSDPAAPQFVRYFNPGTQTAGQPAAGDLSPEGLAFIAAANSPTGRAMLAVGNEVSGTVTLYEIDQVGVNEAPGFTKGPNQSVAEDAAAQTVPQWAKNITAGPAGEAGQTVSFLVSADKPELFAVQPAVAADGTLTYTPAPNANGTAIITVIAKDTGGTANGGVDASAPQTFTITITPVADVTIDDVTAPEGNTGVTPFTFTVRRDDDTGTSTVNFATAPGTADAAGAGGGGDFVPVSGQVVFNPGELVKTVVVPVLGDTNIETDQTFTVDLTGPTNATIADASATGTIQNDDVAGPSVAINDVAVTEGNSGTKNVTFTVTLSNRVNKAVVVKFATGSNTAAAGSDYNGKSGTLTFTPFQTTKQITIEVKGDRTPEADETFFVDLTSATNAAIADGRGVGTIRNDDAPAPVVPPPAVRVNDAAVTEGNSGTRNLAFTVTLDKPSTAPVTVKYATQAGTATAGSDYDGKTGTLTFNPGQTSKTVSIPVLGDKKKEADETFFLNLSQVTNATLADGSGRGTIRNDD